MAFGVLQVAEWKPPDGNNTIHLVCHANDGQSVSVAPCPFVLASLQSGVTRWLDWVSLNAIRYCARIAG
jgi:hypothetical protein